jgi:hypothetical protein
MKKALIIVSCIIGLAVASVLNWHLAVTPTEISPIKGDVSADLNAGEDEPMLFKTKGVKLFQANVRPLFSPERRPWVAQAIEAMPDPALLSIELPTPEIPVVAERATLQARLIGIQKTPDDGMALLVDDSGAPPSWLKIGALYKDWTVEEITNSSVSLINGPTTVKFDLYPEPAAGPAAP